jgi:ankyrin repeat protein
MEAADEDETENVRVLLEAGAITNLKDKEGETAFSLTGNKEIQDLLIQYGFVPPLRF